MTRHDSLYFTHTNRKTQMAYSANPLNPQVAEFGADVTVFWDDEAVAYIVARGNAEVARTGIYTEALKMAAKASDEARNV